MRGEYALPQTVWTIEQPDGSILADYMCHQEGICEHIFGEENLKERNYKVIQITISKVEEKSINPPSANYYLTKTQEGKWGVAWWDGGKFWADEYQDGKVLFGIKREFIKEWYLLPI